MGCPNCKGDTDVLDSRERDNYVYRRRRCKRCNHRFSTMEITAAAYDELGRQAHMLRVFMKEAEHAFETMRRGDKDTPRDGSSILRDERSMHGEDVDTEEDTQGRGPLSS